MTRNSSLAEQLATLRQFIEQPEHEPEALQTNWVVTPANDNFASDVTDYTPDALWEISPSPEEILRQVTQNQPERNSQGQIVKWGSLRFSDGTQTEKGSKLGPDGKVVEADIRVPTGGMLNTTDKERSQRGGDDSATDIAASNAFFSAKATADSPAGLFDATKAKKVRRKPKKFGEPQPSKQEARDMLAAAIANTPVMPEVRKCPDGFPYSPKALAELFPSAVKSPSGSGGSQAWSDIGSQREARKEWFDWVDSLPAKDRGAIEALREAKTFEDVGVAAGQSSSYAKYNKGGRKALIAANDNLMAAINKLSA